VKVLLVDDDPGLLELGSYMVGKRLGHEVHLARNGVEALKLAAEVEPNVVIMDIWMPEPDGFQTMYALQEAGYRGVVIMTSALPGQEVEVARHGDIPFLAKPFSLHELEALLKLGDGS